MARSLGRIVAFLTDAAGPMLLSLSAMAVRPDGLVVARKQRIRIDRTFFAD
jgi:hypothetical protein